MQAHLEFLISRGVVNEAEEGTDGPEQLSCRRKDQERLGRLARSGEHRGAAPLRGHCREISLLLVVETPWARTSSRGQSGRR